MASVKKKQRKNGSFFYEIGEEYLDGEVVSVWSDFGRHYRAKDETSFTLAGVESTQGRQGLYRSDCRYLPK